MAPALVVLASLGGALLVLSSPDDTRRVWGFRAYVAIIGILAVRALVRWIATVPPTVRPEPFRPHRRRWLRRRPPATTRRGSDRVLHLATFSAGDAHRTLRPLLQEIADERLRADHGLTIDDPAAASRLAPATWELVRPDRPPPHDLRAPGLDPATIDSILTDLEAL
jgi:hypothetical protein